jgi:superfamily II DNA/RNA helicase
VQPVSSKPYKFSDFDFSPALLTVIKDANYSKPTPVQVKAIPAILQRRDVLAGAETGSGKTAAFALPLLEKLLYKKQKELDTAARGNHIRALILVPTRELALQISDEVNAYARSLLPTRIKSLAVFGGVKINPQMMALRGGADVLVATPGRLLDLASQNAIKFNKLHTLVLDEVDRLVGDGFKDEIEEVFRLLPSQRQNLMFTATFPDSIRYLIRRLLKKPVIINVSPSAEVLIDQRVFTVNYDQKNALLAHLLETYDWKQILIFCSAKKSCDNLLKKLENRDIKAVAMHSNKEQRARTKALREFKAGETRILIATDVAARGLDIENLPCVINFELPRSPNDYTHRIGRTGRAGETGFAISLIAHHEYSHFSVIEKRNGLELKREKVAGFEADATAPAMPTRHKPKKKAPQKLSKKKRQRLLDKKQQQKHDATVAPQKISRHDNEDTADTLKNHYSKPDYSTNKPSPYDTNRKQTSNSQSDYSTSKQSPYTKSSQQTSDSKPDYNASKQSPYAKSSKQTSNSKPDYNASKQSPYAKSSQQTSDSNKQSPYTKSSQQSSNSKPDYSASKRSPYAKDSKQAPRKNQDEKFDKKPAYSKNSEQPPRKNQVGKFNNKPSYPQSSEQPPRKNQVASLAKPSPYDEGADKPARSEQSPRKNQVASLPKQSPYKQAEQQAPKKNQVENLPKQSPYKQAEKQAPKKNQADSLNKQPSYDKDARKTRDDSPKVESSKPAEKPSTVKNPTSKTVEKPSTGKKPNANIWGAAIERAKTDS